MAIFLARRPARLVATDLVRRRWLPRTSVAAGFSLFYGLVAVAGGAGALVTAAAPFWQPIAMAVPLAGFALYADANRKSRTLFAEIAGSVAIDLSEHLDRRARRFMCDGAAYTWIAMRQAIDDAGLTTAMTNSFGFGGTKATLVYRRMR